MLDEENLARSIRRTQSEISDLVDCNPFEWFGTFTFSPDKIDRYNDKEVYAALSKWLNNQRRTSPNMIYLLVPERHKDGALHFHALFGGYEGVMAYSGKNWGKDPIFNVKAFKYGFTNFTRIRNKARTANYCRKYITKELMTEKNKRRYWASKNLQRPIRIENLTVDDIKNYPIDQENAAVYENDHVITTTLPFKR